mgnify:CR=1 FL=1
MEPYRSMAPVTPAVRRPMTPRHQADRAVGVSPQPSDDVTGPSPLEGNGVVGVVRATLLAAELGVEVDQIIRQLKGALSISQEVPAPDQEG